MPAASRASRSRSPASATWPISSSDAAWGSGERGRRTASALARAAWRIRGAGSIGAQREDEEVGGARGAAQEVQHELDRGVVGPVQVVEEERDGLLAPEHLEQGAQRAVAAEPLAGADGGGTGVHGGRGGGEDRGEVGAGGLDPAGVQGGDVVVEGVDHEAEGHVALVLGRAAVEHEQAGLVGPGVHGVEQRALADAGLAEHGEDAAAAILDGSMASAAAASSRSRPSRRPGASFMPRPPP